MKTNNNTRFFLRSDGARLVWDVEKNAIVACALNNVFATNKKAVADRLTKDGYPEVTADRLEELGYKQPPEADRLNWGVRHDARYTMMDG